MVALAELKSINDLTPERELELWRTIRAHGDYQGSLPGLIAIRARQEGTDAAVLIDPERLRDAEHRLGPLAAFDVPALLSDHRQALRRASDAGVAVVTQTTDGIQFLERLRHGERLLLASPLEVAGGVALHWRLYRMEAGTIWEMDPETSDDTPLAANQFQMRLSEDAFIGAAVALQASLRPPPLQSRA